MSNKKSVALTVGVFDVFHEGHENLLTKMLERGEHLFVILHDDLSTMRNKRHVPVQSYVHRADMLQKWAVANNVSITIVETTLADPSKEIQFVIDECKSGVMDLVYLRGDDWLEFPGREVLEQNGIEIEFVPYTEGVSTTEIRKENGV